MPDPRRPTDPLRPAPPDPKPADQLFRDDVAALAAAIEERAPIAVTAAPRPARATPFWVLGTTALLTVAAVETAVLMRDPAPDYQPPTAAVVEVLDRDPCARRLQTMMSAIDDYARAHGGPPATLDSLYPGHLAAPPRDPIYGVLFTYERDGEGLAISCRDAVH